MRIVTLVLVPLLLAALAASHPLIFPQIPLYRQIDPMPQWWVALHVIQLPLLGLLGTGIGLLTRDLRGIAVSVSRVGVIGFLVFYPAMIAILGISLPMLVRFGQALPPAAQEIVAAAAQTIWDDRMVGNFSLVSLSALFFWALALLGAAVALRRVGAPSVPLALWVTGGIFFGLSHARPFGAIGMLLFAAGSAWLLRRLSMRGREL